MPPRRPLISAELFSPTPATCRRKTPASTTRRINRSTCPALPLYAPTKPRTSLQYFKPVHVGENDVRLSPELAFRFVRAAHILGSCMAEVIAQHGRTDAAVTVQRRHWARARSQNRTRESCALRSGRRRDRRPGCNGIRPTATGRIPKEILCQNWPLLSPRRPDGAAASSSRHLRLSARRSLFSFSST